VSRKHPVLPSLPVRTLAVVALGGVIGALARYGLQSAFPLPPAGFGWATFGINVAGCLLIGLVHTLAGPRLRPFLGTGVLGGFTTFSTYAVGVQRELAAGLPRAALLYGAATVIAALGAAWAGIRAGTAVTRGEAS
jgi:CrcB protein